MTTRRRVKVPGAVLERAREVALEAPKKPSPPAAVKGKQLPREKVIAALSRLKPLKSHPMD